MHQSRLSPPSYFRLSLLSISLFCTCQTAYTEDSLEQINVIEETDTNTTEGSRSYTIKSMKTATGLKVSGKDTPQSVSVITKKQLESYSYS